MSADRKCPNCDAPLCDDAPEGNCPNCLLRLALLGPGEGTVNSSATVSIPSAKSPADRIGRYKLLEKIGEGGFGVVFMAEQLEPVQRKVALKIIKAGMDTRAVIARFEAEWQALALMDHPNIARVLDAGATEAGRPYFVMELVRGIPITDYCDQATLTTRERLLLFMKVCQAVQHAHQKGVIHRDLKPGNVLVTEYDGEPVPKVIDFGVAKALGQKLTEKTLFTGFEHMIGTPAYMCPEQAALSGLDIDTRADVYSLGVLLYELLTGETPFGAEIFRKAALDEIRRMIRETEPLKPSTRLRTLGKRLPEVARYRQTEPASLSRLLRGDLDWIVMKCLEKDRQRRYETATGLAADVARHLKNEAVAARPPSNLYRFRKLVRRHKVAVAAASAVATVLVLGVVVSTGQALRATHAEQEQTRLRLQAEGALAQVQIQTASQFFSANDDATAFAYLARVLRQNPANEAVAAQVFSNLTQHNLLVPLTGPLKHDGEVRYAQFSPNGQRVVTASWDGTARVWNALTGEPITPPLQHTGKVNRAQFDPTGSRVVTASDDNTARVWDANTGQLLTTIEHNAGVGDACFSPDGELLFTATTSNSGRVWDARSGRPLTAPFGVGNTVQRDLRPFSPDGRKYVSTTQSAGFICDSRTGERLVGPLPLDGGGYIAAEFCPKGLRVATSGKTARVWDAQTGALVSEVKQDGPITLARFSPDGQRLLTYATNPDYTAQVWNANTGRALTGPVKVLPRTAQFSPNGQWVLTAGRAGAELWDTSTGQLLMKPSKRDEIVWGQLSPDGERLVTGSRDRYARVWGIRIGYRGAASVSLPTPDWVPGLLDALAGKRLNDQGIVESVPDTQLLSLRRRLSQSPASDVWSQWAIRLFAGATIQTNSPR